MPKIDIYNLSDHGVIINPSVTHRPSGSFERAANALPLPFEEGGISKRGGMVRLNTTAMSGPVRGMVNVPLPDQRQLVRTLWIGLSRQDAPIDYYWMKSTDGGDTWTLVGPSAGIAQPQQFLTGYGTHIFSELPRIISLNQKLWYPQHTTVTPTLTEGVRLHVWDGTTDEIILDFPSPPLSDPPDPNDVLLVADMIVANGMIYLGVFHDGGTAPNHRGQVLELNPYTWELRQVAGYIGTGGDVTDAQGFPLSLGLFQGTLFVGCYGYTGGGQGRILASSPYESDWRTDNAGVAGTYVSGLQAFQGSLYISHASATAGVAYVVRRRTAAGSYSVVETAPDTDAYNKYGRMIVYQGALYVPYTNQTTGNEKAIIRKFDGTTWTTDLDINTTFGTWTKLGQSLINDQDLIWIGTGHIQGSSDMVLRKRSGTWSNITPPNIPSGYHLLGNVGYTLQIV